MSNVPAAAAAPVIPAQAGIRRAVAPASAADWVPAFAGMTMRG